MDSRPLIETNIPTFSETSTRLPERLLRLLAGLLLFGFSIALMVRADLGLASWDVLHQGLASRTGLPVGLMVNLVALAVLLLWIPLRQRPGIGTVVNVALVGTAVELSLAVLPPVTALPLRGGLLLAGIALNGVATALYLGARLGPGPRDGLMTGLAARGVPIRRARTVIELGVLGLGWVLGGTVGLGTVLYALSIGPLAHRLIPLFAVPTGGPAAPLAPAGSTT